jgi:hypothetical protein
MGVALYLLVRDLPGRAARVRRLAIGPFVLFYAVWEGVIGVATGALVQHANDLPAGERHVVSDAIQSLQENVVVGEMSVAAGLVCFAGAVGVLVVRARSAAHAPRPLRAPGVA